MIWEGGLSPDTLRQINDADAMIGLGLAKKTLFPADAHSVASVSGSHEVSRTAGGGGRGQLLDDPDDEFSLDPHVQKTSAGPAEAAAVVGARLLPVSRSGGTGYGIDGGRAESGDVAARNVPPGNAAAPVQSAAPIGASAPTLKERGPSGRKEIPAWRLWDLPDLKAEAVGIAGARAGLKFGPMEGDILTRLSQRKKTELVEALVARAKFRDTLGLAPEWLSTPIGKTPEKRKQREQQMVNKGLKAAGVSGGGKGSGKKHTNTASQCFQARMVCLMLDENIFQLYQRYKGGKGGLTRGEQDAGQMGKNHQFFVVLAKAMANIE